MSGVWSELRDTGEIGPLAAALIYDTVDAVRRFDRYPPPEGTDQWDPSAVQEVAHEFLAGDGSEGRLSRIVATATDEESFERVLEAAVRNHFRMAARSTDTGAVLRSLTHAIDVDDAVVVAGTTSTTRTWSLKSFEDGDPYAGEIAPLITAAHAVPDVRRARWSKDSARRAPIAEPDSLRRVIHAILDAAGAPVSPRLMLDVVLARFPLAAGGPGLELDEALVPVNSANADARLLAMEVWDQLTDNERLVTGVLDLPVREMAEATGLTRSTAQRSATSAREVLAAFLTDVADASAVVAVLAEASETFRTHGTTRAGSASTGLEEE